RPLPAVRAGRGADGRAGPVGVPVLGVLAPDPARRYGSGEPGRFGVLRPAHRYLAGPGDPAGAHPVPLGPTTGTGGPGPLGAPGHRVPVRRLRRSGGRPAGRPDRAVEHAERAVVLGVSRVRLGRARA